MRLLLSTHSLKLDSLLFAHQLQRKEGLVVGHVSDVMPPAERQTEDGNVSTHVCTGRRIPS